MNGMPIPFHLAMFFGSDGPMEWMIVALAVLMLFGSQRLPDMMRTLGRLSAKLYRARDEFRKEFQKAIELPDESEVGDRRPEVGDRTSEVGSQRAEVGEHPDMTSCLPQSNSKLQLPASSIPTADVQHQSFELSNTTADPSHSTLHLPPSTLYPPPGPADLKPTATGPGHTSEFEV